MDEINWHAELRRTWVFLGNPTEPSEGIRASVLLGAREVGALRVYVDAEGARHLLVAGPSAAAAPTVNTASLRAAPRRLVFDGVTTDCYDITCALPGLFGVFDDLLVSIVRESAGAEDPVRAADDALAEWRELLRVAAGPLAYERELGLFAELWMLDRLTASAAVDPERWRGPLREPKDLVSSVCWVEVKGVGLSVDHVTINGLEQLQDIESLGGYLALVTIEEGGAGAQTIGEVIDELRQRCPEPDALTERLELAGWSTASATQRRWDVREVSLVPAASCPRLTPESLSEGQPVGLRVVRYELETSILRALALPDSLNVLGSLWSMT